MSKHKPFPVPEAKIDGRCTMHTIEAGPLKHIFVDRNAGAEGKPCWLIYVPEHKLVYRAREWNTTHMEGLNARGRGHKDTPLMPDGPALWVETSAAIEVYT